MNSDDSLQKTISVLEQYEKEIKETVTVQKAMIDNIPYYLQRNLAVLQKYFPNLYEKFKNYSLTDNYKLICNSNGEPNILYPDGHLFYTKTPFLDCKRQVEDYVNNFYNWTIISDVNQEINYYNQLHIYYKNKLFSKVADLKKRLTDLDIYKKQEKQQVCESVPVMFMFGLGLGFHLGYLYERVTPVNLYIIEPCSDFFYLSLCVFDYSTLFDYVKSQNLGLKFFIGEDQSKMLMDISTYSAKYPMNFAATSFYNHYPSEKMRELWKTLERDIVSLIWGAGFFDDTLTGMCQSRLNILNHIPFLEQQTKLPEQYTSVPVLVIGSGPSLDAELELIQKNNNKVFIIACGTALTALLNYGINVDIFVAVERTPDVYISQLTINNPNILDNILCVAPDTTDPSTMNLFKHKVIGFKANEAMYRALAFNKKLDNYQKFYPLSLINPLVANMGIVIATFLQFKEIYLVGVDCGTAYDESHSKYSMYYENNKLKDEWADMPMNVNPNVYPGNFTDTVRTNDLFTTSIHCMERVINENKHHLTYYNASNGAKIEGCIPRHLSEINFTFLKEPDHQQFRDFIENEMSEPINISEQDFVDILNLDRSFEIIDTLIDDLKKPSHSRKDIILKFESHMDFLRNCNKEIGIVASRAVQGSLSDLYWGYITALYCQIDETNAINDANELLPLIIDFLEKAKEYLPKTYDYSFEYVKTHIKPLD